MRFPKPFFRRSKQAWYLQLGRRQISLGPDRDEAFLKYKQLVLHGEEAATTASLPIAYRVAELFDLFLEHSVRHHERKTYLWYRSFLQRFCERCGEVLVSNLKPFHLNRWLDQQSWGPTTRNKVIGCLKRAFNWAVDEGLLETNPLRAVKKQRPMKTQT